jgi:hypothetical protein
MLLLILTGCEEARIEQELFENNAIKSVQEAESLYPGVSCLKYMGGIVQISESSGRYIKVKGWMAYKEPGHAVVVFQADENEKPLEWKWYIENGTVIPVNDLAQNTIRRQKAKYN